MIHIQTKRVTDAFYAWERIGRGWHLAPRPIELEPEFIPYYAYIQQDDVILDDGMRPTLLSSLFSKKQPQILQPFTPPERQLYFFDNDEEIIVLQIQLQRSYVFQQQAMEELLGMLQYARHHISFEIIATDTLITFQFTCRESEATFIEGQIKAHIHNIVVTRRNREEVDLLLDDGPTVSVDFGLENEFMCPIRTKVNGEPYVPLFSILDSLHSDEQICIQILFNGTVNNWRESIIESVTTPKGDSFFYDMPIMPKLAQEKVSSPLFAVTMRLTTQAITLDRAYAVVKQATIALQHSTSSEHNTIQILSTDNYDFETRITDILYRESHRSGMFLNAKELAVLAHIPSATISSKFAIQQSKTKALEQPQLNTAYSLGVNKHAGIDIPIALSTEQRLKHLHIIGGTGTGKSTLLLNLIQQDIRNGTGCMVLDPHGDLIETLLSIVPKERINDVIVIDPSDYDYPVGFNILTAFSDIEMEVLASDLVAIFKRFSSSWGDQMHSVLSNTILAFLESTKGGTLEDVRRFLVEKSFREAFLGTVTDEHLLYYWKHEYPILKTNSIGSILTRLDSFLRPKVIRAMLTQRSSLNFESIISTKKIILVKLSHGLIGAENSHLLGSLLVSKLQQAVMARQAVSKEDRIPFYLYIDEFQYFATHSMSMILEGARKYGLGLVLAHQSMQQLQRDNAELSSAILNNAGTRICFRVGEQDAKVLSSGFSSFEPSDFQKLKTGQAICRIERSDNDCNIETMPFINHQGTSYKDEIIEYSRTKYSSKFEPKTYTEKPLAEVKEFAASSTPSDEQDDNDTSQPLQEEVPKPSPTIPKPQPLTTDTKQATLQSLIKLREQKQHRQLQQTVKKIGEDHGYRATIEYGIPGTKEKVDVLLQRDNAMLPVEVSVTTNPEWEMHNIQKCMNAGFKTIIVICSETKTKQNLAVLVQQVHGTTIHLTDIEGFPKLLAPKKSPKPQEQIIKGYRVKVEYSDKPPNN